MGDVTPIPKGGPRRLRETVYTERGLRLLPARQIVTARWFWPAMILLPASTFLIVFLW